MQNLVVVAGLYAVGNHTYISLLPWHPSPYKDSTGSLNEKTTVSAHISTHSHVIPLPNCPTAPALPQRFSLQIWRTIQDPEHVEGWCLCNTSWIPASYQDCINTCCVMLCFLYFLFYATFSIKMHHLSKESGHETHFSHQSNATFSYHHTTKAARNLVFPFTPAVMQTPNACMAMLPMNSNGKSNKTTSSSAILSSIVFEQARQLLLYYSNICVCWHQL